MKLGKLAALFSNASYASVMIAMGVLSQNMSAASESVVSVPVETINPESVDTSGPEFLHIVGPAKPYYGLVEYCAREGIDCEQGAEKEEMVIMTPELFKALSDRNLLINEIIGQATDRENYGVEEVWIQPEESGDCEDFVFAKEDDFENVLKISKGATSYVGVKTEVDEKTGKREGHLLYRLRTDKGDYFFDNRRDDVLRADQLFPADGSQYIPLKTSSFTDMLKWHELENPGDAIAALPADPTQDFIDKALKDFTTQATFRHKPKGFTP